MPLFTGVFKNWGIRKPTVPLYASGSTQLADFVDGICCALMSNPVVDKMRTFDEKNPFRRQKTDFGKTCYELIGVTINKLQSEARNIDDCLLILTDLLTSLNLVCQAYKRILTEMVNGGFNKYCMVQQEVSSTDHPLIQVVNEIQQAVTKAVAEIAAKREAFLSHNPQAIIFRHFSSCIAPNPAQTLTDWRRQTVVLSGITTCPELRNIQANYIEARHSHDPIGIYVEFLASYILIRGGFTRRQAQYLVGFLNQKGLKGNIQFISDLVVLQPPNDKIAKPSLKDWPMHAKYINERTVECAVKAIFDICDMNNDEATTNDAFTIDYKVVFEWEKITDANPKIKDFSADFTILPVRFADGTELRTLLSRLAKKLIIANLSPVHNPILRIKISFRQ